MSHTYDVEQGDTSTDTFKGVKVIDTSDYEGEPGRVEVLQTQVKATQAKVKALEVQTKAALYAWIKISNRLEALETEIAFQRKVNSSWQTPVPERPGESA